ncbi:unnamed protein product [Cuscuta campestris]|uniref:Uncharacterized protein n=1 Tax=Cuscuta campestris TaxID=132261 RepID=A0A484MHM2_9ASTE|nr:unnamed protein product [Cuscuta campestris]
MKILLAEDEEAAHEQGVLLVDLPQAKHPAVQKDVKVVPLTGDDAIDERVEADAVSLSAVLKNKGRILSSLQETVLGFPMSLPWELFIGWMDNLSAEGNRLSVAFAGFTLNEE